MHASQYGLRKVTLSERNLVAKAALANFIMVVNMMSGIVRHAEATELIRSWLDSLNNDGFDDGDDSDETGSTYSFSSAMSDAL